MLQKDYVDLTEELKEVYADKKTTIYRLVSERKEVERELEGLRTQCLDFESTVSNKEARVVELQRALQQVQMSMEQSLSGHGRVEAELKNMKNALEIFNKADTRKDTELVNVHAEVERLHSKCMQLEEELKSAKQHVETIAHLHTNLNKSEEVYFSLLIYLPLHICTVMS
jgi:chromosome segregation ATPase